MNTTDDLEMRVRLAALARHNAEQDARCYKTVLLIVLALSAACAAAAFML